MKNSHTLTLIGVLFILGGFLSFTFPIPKTLASNGIVDWAILVIGIATIIASWQIDNWKERVVLLVIGLLAVFIGWSLLANPFVGILRLSLLVSVLFLLGGAFKVFAAFWYKIRPHFWIILISGLVSLIIGAIGVVGFPFSAAVMLGFLLSVELLSNGVAILSLASRANESET